MKKKVLKILIVLVLVIGVLSAAGIYVYNRIVDEMFVSMISGMDITVDDNMLKELEKSLGEAQGDGFNSGAEGGEKSAQGDKSGKGGQTGQRNKAGSSNGTAAAPGEKVTVTKDKAREVVDKISPKDRAIAEGIIRSKLSLGDIAMIQGLVSGGKTQEAKEVLKSRITVQEKETLKSLFYRYQWVLSQ